MQALSQGDVTPEKEDENPKKPSPVSQRGNDQSRGVPQILVAVLELSVTDVGIAVTLFRVPPGEMLFKHIFCSSIHNL